MGKMTNARIPESGLFTAFVIEFTYQKRGASVDFSQLTPEQLNGMDKRALIGIITSLQGQLATISTQLNFLTEQIALMNQRSFGRKTEKLDQMDDMHQMSLFDVFNEPEVFQDNSEEPEISEITVSSHIRKKKTKREDSLEGLPARIFEHRIGDDKLAELFPNGYKELPEEVYKRLSIIPQTLLVDEHHVHVYASKNNDGTIIKAERPADLFRNSIATAPLVATLITGKYANHLPLERQSKAFKDNGVKLETNTIANWMIKASYLYLSILYDELHKHLFKSHVVHADETPFEVIKDGRKAGSNSYMWVYRNGECDSKHPVVIYDYQPTRRLDHPDDFLKDYTGVLVTDGYQVYHSLEKKRKALKVAGCWVHAKRKFAELVKAIDTGPSDEIIAAEAVKRISELFHIDNLFSNLSSEERLKQRQTIIKPKVDDFFVWARTCMLKLPAGGTTYKGLQYCINQEQFLRVFLEDGDVPMHNNPAEQAIRPFTLGRKNWMNVYSINGAQASAVIYSIVETAKANNLRIYDYLEFLLSELSQHSGDTSLDFLKDLLPWNQTVQEKFHSLKKS